MANTIRLKALDNSDIEYVDSIIGSGAMKNVYFSPDKSYVVAFFKTKQDYNARERLRLLTTEYRQKIFEQTGGDYWRNSYCWPEKLVEHEGKLGLVCPTYPSHFFFKYGSINNDANRIKGKEKEGKWFASPMLKNTILLPEERGSWFQYFQISLNISRAVRRLHAAGLAHSDLSYKNILIDPTSGKAAIIDIDGLVVPGKFPPDVLGTPDFIAPEVMATRHLAKDNKDRRWPNIRTDQHALAVLIYYYLLNRHPLKGGKVNDIIDPDQDEELSMGNNALFIENPSDFSNRVKTSNLKKSELPYGNPNLIPYSVLGPYLKELCDRVFIEGLHNPEKRPIANEWENALIKTVDLLQPCSNKNCLNKWYVFNNTTKSVCPFCGTKYSGLLPMLDLYSSRGGGKFTSDNHRVMVYSNQYIYLWHSNSFILPNEKLINEQKKPVGYFVFHNGKWLLVNQNLPDLKDVTEDKTIAINKTIELTEGRQILFSKENGGRLAIVKLVSGA
jgi:serine/threonine protein kinase